MQSANGRSLIYPRHQNNLLYDTDSSGRFVEEFFNLSVESGVEINIGVVRHFRASNYIPAGSAGYFILFTRGKKSQSDR